MKKILDAIAQYVKRKPDIPAPADIVNIIDPSPPILSGAAYIGLRKHLADNIYLTPSDRAFLHAYEKQETDKIRGPSHELINANYTIDRYRNCKALVVSEGWD